jgi:GntR family transcriptional regulator
MPGYGDKWERIADDLRAQISQGTLAPGDRLPPETRLMETWGMAKGTVARAMRDLGETGLVETRGQFRYVIKHERVTVHVTRTLDRTSPGELPTAGADSWLADIERAGEVPNLKLDVRTDMAEGEVATRLGLLPGQLVTVRHNIRLAGGQPHNWVTFWFPAAVASGTRLAEPGSITEGSLAWLERNYGPLDHEVEVIARMPSSDERRELRINNGPVMEVWRTSWATAARAVVTSRALYPADRVTLRMEL